MSFLTRSRAIAIVGAASAATLLAGTAIAGAYNVVPGADDTGKVVITGSEDLKITLETSEDGSQVAVSVINDSGKNFTCSGAKNNEATTGDVTEAPIVALAMDYYSTQLNREPADLMLKISGLGGSTQYISTASVEGFLPGGAFGSLLSDAYAARSEIAGAHDAARVAGHAADINKFNLNAGATHDVTVTLGQPSVGPREAFDAAGFLLCQSGGELYAFAGYENGEPVPDSPDSGGSLGGSLGS